MHWRLLLVIIIIIALSIAIFIFVSNRIDYSEGEPDWGITYSVKYAEELGLDPKVTYLSILDDLNVSHIRMPSYWDRIEKTPGNFYFRELDWLIEEASRRDVKIVLVLGQRQPRWPECHIPDWAQKLPTPLRNERVLKFNDTVVQRYQGNNSIVVWQVENEPFLDVFGECEPTTLEFVESEITRVKSLDDRPVMVAESGELSTWVRGAQIADILGVSLYRITWNKYLGYFYYPIAPDHYHSKIELIKPLVNEIICTELQVEPWAPEGITNMSHEEMIKALPLKKAQDNIDFARRVGFPEIYLWGAEWWYYMKKDFNDDSYWNEMKKLWE